jgi:hypothetical protein
MPAAVEHQQAAAKISEQTLVFSTNLRDLHESWRRHPRRILRRPAARWKTELFLGALLVVCFLLTLTAFWPILRDVVFGSGHMMGDADMGMARNRIWYHAGFVWIGAIGAAYLVGCWMWCLGEPWLRKTKTLALLGGLLYGALLMFINNRIEGGQRLLGALDSSNIFEQQWQNLQNLHVIDCESPFFDTYALRKELRRQNCDTFADFHRGVMADYRQRETPLRETSAIAAEASEAKLKTLFIMNFVSGLWSFGNKIELTKPGCVLCNEKNNWTASRPTMRAYLDSRIGCCTDYALMVKFLLDEEKIENRLTAIPGHVFNEVRLEGRWCIVDATTNMFLEQSWQELYERKSEEPIKVYVFPHANMSGNFAYRYRPLAGQFRLLTLLRVANRPECLREATHPEVVNSLRGPNSF